MNWMLGFPTKILPMMGFLTCNNSNIFWQPKLVSIGGMCIEPFSHLHHNGCFYFYLVSNIGDSQSHATQLLNFYNSGVSTFHHSWPCSVHASRLFMEDVGINSARTKLMCLVTSNAGVKIIHRRHRYQWFRDWVNVAWLQVILKSRLSTADIGINSPGTKSTWSDYEKCRHRGMGI